MKTKFKLLSVLLAGCFILINCNQSKKPEKNITNEACSKFNELAGPYLGQKPPGDVPELFAPGIVADIGSEHTAAAFTPDGKELFWTRILNPGQRPRTVAVMHMKQEKGIWRKPKLAPFNLGLWTSIAYISPDGKQLYIGSWRPVENSRKPHTGVWVVDKTAEGWSKPQLPILPLNFKKDYRFQQKTRSGNLYLRRKLTPEARASALFCSKFVDMKYEEPQLLGKTINSNHLDYSFYIDPSEKFIIFASNRPQGFAAVDLYISYRQPDDSWGVAINLGKKINTAGQGGSAWPYLSPDSKYLFFLTSVDAYKNFNIKDYNFKKIKKISRSNLNGYSKIYWVNTDFIEKLKPSHLK